MNLKRKLNSSCSNYRVTDLSHLPTGPCIKAERDILQVLQDLSSATGSCLEGSEVDLAM